MHIKLNQKAVNKMKKCKIKYIIKGGTKYYAFEDNSYYFETKEEIRKRLTKWNEDNKNYPERLDNVENITESLFNERMQESNDVISIFRKYYGIDIYDLSLSDYFNNPTKYLKSFDDDEIIEIKNLIKTGKLLCFYTYYFMMRGVITVNIKNHKKNFDMKTNNYGYMDKYSNKDILWLEKNHRYY